MSQEGGCCASGNKEEFLKGAVGTVKPPDLWPPQNCALTHVITISAFGKLES